MTRSAPTSARVAFGLLVLMAGGAAGAQPPEHHEHHRGGEPAAREMDREPPAATPVPPPTDEDRAAAFPPVAPRRAEDARLDSLVLLDRLEWESGAGLRAESKGWVGSLRNRLRFRAAGRALDRGLDDASAGVFYGRAVRPFWDLVAGLHRESLTDRETRLAVGVAGLAPYRFEVEALVFLGPGGRTGFHLETEYSLLLTNRLMLEPIFELEAEAGGDISPASLGLEGALRLRYEIRREFAPYAALSWRRPLAERAGEGRAGGTRLTAGVRFWF